MNWVSTILTVLAVMSGMLMTFLILLQEGKGGSLAALGGTVTGSPGLLEEADGVPAAPAGPDPDRSAATVE